MKMIKKEEVVKGENSCDRPDIDGGQCLLEHNKVSFLSISNLNGVNGSEVSLFDSNMSISWSFRAEWGHTRPGLT